MRKNNIVLFYSISQSSFVQILCSYILKFKEIEAYNLNKKYDSKFYSNNTYNKKIE